jgi:ArsR family transcriptional regulator
MKVLGITQSKASRHLRNLYHARLVTDRRDGLWVYYSVRRPQPALVRSTLRALKTELHEDQAARTILDSMASWLARKDAERRCAG